jgi:hypothetical protein
MNTASQQLSHGPHHVWLKGPARGKSKLACDSMLDYLRSMVEGNTRFL